MNIKNRLLKITSFNEYKNKGLCLILLFVLGINFPLLGQFKMTVLNPTILIQQQQLNLNVLQIRHVSAPNERGVLNIVIVDHLGQPVAATGQLVFRMDKSGLLRFEQTFVPLTFYQKELETYHQMVGCLPPSLYQLKVQFNPATGGRNSEIVSHTFEFKQFCQFVLKLARPINKSKVPTTASSFHWISSVFQSLPSLAYQIAVFEIQKGQTKEDAVLKNRPILQQNTKFLNHQFFSNLPQVSQADRFAWQVTALWLGHPIAQTDVWELLRHSELVEETQKKLEPEEKEYPITNYHLAGDLFNPPFYQQKNPLIGYYFRVSNDWDNYELNLINPRGKLGFTKPLKVNAGINYQEIDLENAPKGKYEILIKKNKNPYKSLIVKIK